MDKIKNEQGNGVLFFMIGLFLIGIVYIGNQFWVGYSRTNRSNLQNIIDKGTRRAGLELKTDTEDDLVRLGDGLSFEGSILNETLIIDRDKSKNAFFRVLKLNGLDLTSDQVVLLTPINITDTGYSVYLEGKENTAAESTYSSLDNLKSGIQSYLKSKGKDYVLHFDTNIIDKPTYLAVVEYKTGKKIEMIQSFGGGQVFRVGE